MAVVVDAVNGMCRRRSATHIGNEALKAVQSAVAIQPLILLMPTPAIA